MGTTDLGAVRPFRFPRPHALDKDSGSCPGNLFVSFADGRIEFQVSQNPFILTVKVLSGHIFFSTHGHNNDSMLQGNISTVLGDSCLEISYKPGGFFNTAFLVHINQGMTLHLVDHLFNPVCNFISPPGIKEPKGISSQFTRLLHKVCMEPLLSQAKGRRHAGDTAPDHQRLIVHRNGRLR